MTSGKSSGNLVTAAETAATGNVYLGETQLAMAWRRLRRDRVAMVGLVLVLLLALVAVLAPWIAPYDPVTDYNLRNRLQPPSKEHWLGTDASGGMYSAASCTGPASPSPSVLPPGSSP